eukprot:gene9613-7528_t
MQQRGFDIASSNHMSSDPAAASASGEVPPDANHHHHAVNNHADALASQAAAQAGPQPMQQDQHRDQLDRQRSQAPQLPQPSGHQHQLKEGVGHPSGQHQQGTDTLGQQQYAALQQQQQLHATVQIGQPLEFLNSLLQRLMALDREGFFKFPVDEVLNKAPNYYAVIKQPMCFQDLRERMADGRCRSFRSFRDEFELICNNARKFNSTKTRVHKSASVLQKNGGRILKQYELDIRKAFTLLHPESSSALPREPSSISLATHGGAMLASHGSIQHMGSMGDLGQAEMSVEHGEMGVGVGGTPPSLSDDGKGMKGVVPSTPPQAGETPEIEAGKKVWLSPLLPPLPKCCTYVTDNEDDYMEESQRSHSMPFDSVLSHIKTGVVHQPHTHPLRKRARAIAAGEGASPAAAAKQVSKASSGGSVGVADTDKPSSSTKALAHTDVKAEGNAQARRECYWLELRMAELRSLQHKLETRLLISSIPPKAEGISREAPEQPLGSEETISEASKDLGQKVQQQDSRAGRGAVQQQYSRPSTGPTPPETAARPPQPRQSQVGWSSAHAAVHKHYSESLQACSIPFFSARLRDPPSSQPSLPVGPSEREENSAPPSNAPSATTQAVPSSAPASPSAPPSSAPHAAPHTESPRGSQPPHAAPHVDPPRGSQPSQPSQPPQPSGSGRSPAESALCDRLLPASVFGALELLDTQLVNLREQLLSICPQRRGLSNRTGQVGGIDGGTQLCEAFLSDVFGEQGGPTNLSVMTKRKRSEADGLMEVLSPGSAVRHPDSRPSRIMSRAASRAYSRATSKAYSRPTSRPGSRGFVGMGIGMGRSSDGMGNVGSMEDAVEGRMRRMNTRGRRTVKFGREEEKEEKDDSVMWNALSAMAQEEGLEEEEIEEEKEDKDEDEEKDDGVIWKALSAMVQEEGLEVSIAPKPTANLKKGGLKKAHSSEGGPEAKDALMDLDSPGTLREGDAGLNQATSNMDESGTSPSRRKGGRGGQGHATSSVDESGTSPPRKKGGQGGKGHTRVRREKKDRLSRDHTDGFGNMGVAGTEKEGGDGDGGGVVVGGRGMRGRKEDRKREKAKRGIAHEDKVEALAGGGSETLVGEKAMKGIANEDEVKALAGGGFQTLAGGESETLEGGGSETLAGGESETLAGGESETLAGGESETLAGGGSETLADGESETLAGGVSETLDGGGSETLAGGGSETLDGGGSETLAGEGSETLVEQQEQGGRVKGARKAEKREEREAKSLVKTGQKQRGKQDAQVGGAKGGARGDFQDAQPGRTGSGAAGRGASSGTKPAVVGSAQAGSLGTAPLGGGETAATHGAAALNHAGLETIRNQDPSYAMDYPALLDDHLAFEVPAGEARPLKAPLLAVAAKSKDLGQAADGGKSDDDAITSWQEARQLHQLIYPLVQAPMGVTPYRLLS